MTNRMSLWSLVALLIIVLAVIVIGAALAAGRYVLAGVTLVVVAAGLPLAARIGRLRKSLRSRDS